MSTNPLRDNTIILPITRYIDLVLGGGLYEHSEIPELEATILASKPQAEYLYHIELPSATSKITKPRLWSKKAWLASQEKTIKTKYESENSRRQACIFAENRARLVEKICSMSGLAKDDIFVKELAEQILRKYPQRANKTFGAKVEKPETLSLEEFKKEFRL